MDIYRNITKFKTQNTLFFNALLVDIFLISLIFLLITLIFNLCFTEIIYCDNIDQIITSTSNPISEQECVSHNGEASMRAGLETPSGILIKYKLIIRRKLYWYFSGSNSSQYNNYEEFKQTWKPEMSLRQKLKDQFRIAINNPQADFAQTRNKARQALENRLQEDAILAERLRRTNIALDAYRIDRLYRSVRK